MREQYFPHIPDMDITAPDGTPIAAALQPVDAALMGISGQVSFAPSVVVGQCTSTFDAAWNFLRGRDLPSWSAALALCQSQGRGQLRREWISLPGNLYVSFFLPGEIANLENMASPATGYCIHAALGRMGIATRLKWPNDLLLQGPDGDEGKVGGLLLEEREGRLLAGLGLNMQSAPDNSRLREGRAAPAVALPACGTTVFGFWLDLVRHMRDIFEEEIREASLEAVRRKVEEALAWMGLRIYAKDARLAGELAGLNSDGSLRLRTPFGMETVYSGSIALE